MTSTELDQLSARQRAAAARYVAAAKERAAAAPQTFYGRRPGAGTGA